MDLLSSPSGYEAEQTHFDTFTAVKTDLVATSFSAMYVTVLITGISTFRNVKFSAFRREFEPVNPLLKYGPACCVQYGRLKTK